VVAGECRVASTQRMLLEATRLTASVYLCHNYSRIYYRFQLLIRTKIGIPVKAAPQSFTTVVAAIERIKFEIRKVEAMAHVDVPSEFILGHRKIHKPYSYLRPSRVSYTSKCCQPLSLTLYRTLHELVGLRIELMMHCRYRYAILRH
jgi:hypothetical protein